MISWGKTFTFMSTVYNVQSILSRSNFSVLGILFYYRPEAETPGYHIALSTAMTGDFPHLRLK